MEYREPSDRLSGSVFVTSCLWLMRLSIFVSLVVCMYFAYRFSFNNILHGSWAVGVIMFWALTAYITLPRIHRQLTKLYLPDYFIGRVRTGDGLLGDPVNLAVLGSARELRTAMEAAGWVQADPIRPKSFIKIIRATLLGESYPNAPISALYLFSQRQTFAFQKEIGGSPRQRHHVRFWKTPEHWWLPGGAQADWLGAATFDKHVSLSLFSGQVTHRVAEFVDEERDFVLDSLRTAGYHHINTAMNFTSGFHGRSAYGDRIRTDGALPFIDLQQS